MLLEVVHLSHQCVIMIIEEKIGVVPLGEELRCTTIQDIHQGHLQEECAELR
jgi:hypothetical protein